MIYTVTLNPALDCYTEVAQWQEGGLNEAKRSQIRAGGKGINVSIVLNNLGIRSKAVGFSGGFSGLFIESELTKRGIEHTFVPIADETRVNIKLKSGQAETEIAGISPTVSVAELEKLKELLAQVASGDIVVFSGSVPNGVPSEVYKTMAEMLPKGTKTVLDTRGSLLRQNIGNHFLVKPNISELEEMFGIKLENREKLLEKMEILFSKYAENVIVSLGADGALLRCKNGMFFAPSAKGVLVSAVGAGDSMVAGFLSATEKGQAPEEAFAFAVACGSATAFSDGLAEERAILSTYDQVLVKKLLL